MDLEEFRTNGKEMIDYICEYLKNIDSRSVTPNVKPGYLKELLPEDPPQDPEEWKDVMKDVDEKIIPGLTHWQHSRFHAYFPSGNSFPSILGDMLTSAIACYGFSWATCPASTELEIIVMDWFGKAIGLPDSFITSSKNSRGGGVIQSSGSECIFVAMAAARNRAIAHLKKISPHLDDSVIFPKLVAYCSKQSHSYVEKAAMILLIKLRILDVDEDCSLRGTTLKEAMEVDEAMGYFPFFVSTTLGSIECTSFDKLLEIGPICKSKASVWLHVDAVYAGNAFICPELKPLMAGIEYADSFNTNPNNWLLVNFDCSCLWVKERTSLTEPLKVEPLYLQHPNSSECTDYRHWGVALSRRFRSLKFWFVIKKYGISGLQAYIRNHIRLAKYFASLVKCDNRFEVVNNVNLGLVCFRIIGPDSINKSLLAMCNATGKIHMTSSMVKEKYIIRFWVVAEKATDADIEYAWATIKEQAEILLSTLEHRR